MMGNAAVSLYKQLGGKQSFNPTDTAFEYAIKKCPREWVAVRDNGDDWLYHTISGMAGVWFQNNQAN
jgi:hypothetical protein